MISMETTKRDWVEDSSFSLNYRICSCCMCNETFLGYKHRVICKVCGTALDSTECLSNTSCKLNLTHFETIKKI